MIIGRIILQLIREGNMYNYFKICFSEFIGTFFLVFVGCGAVILSEVHSGSISPMAIPLVFGGIVAMMVYTLSHLSGAHINPAVSLAFAVTGHFPPSRLPIYIISQCLGAITASALHAVLFGIKSHSFGATVHPLMSLPQAFAFEIIISFLLMFVVMGVATDSRARSEMAGLIIGITVAICAYIAGPMTGASMNPARSLGPAIFNETLSTYFIPYVLAPCIGTTLGAVCYEKLKSVAPLANPS